jgi:hypothetical protein
VQRERSKLTTKDPPPTSETREKRKEKLSLLDRFEAICSHLPPKPPRFSRPTIWHWDIQPENIFVKNSRVADIINWQGAWIGPLFLQARRPTLVRQHHGSSSSRTITRASKIQRRKQGSRIKWRSLSCSRVTSGRPDCDTRSYTRCSIFLRHEEGGKRCHLPQVF